MHVDCSKYDITVFHYVCYHNLKIFDEKSHYCVVRSKGMPYSHTDRRRRRRGILICNFMTILIFIYLIKLKKEQREIRLLFKLIISNNIESK